MAIHHYLIFIFLTVQSVIFLLLIIPFPPRLRRSLVNFIADSPLLHRVWQAQSFLTVLVLLFLAESIRQLYISNEEHQDLNEDKDGSHAHHHSEGEYGGLEDKKLHMRIHFAERNIFLTAGCMFMSLVLNRWVAFLRKLNKAEDDLMRLTKENPIVEDLKEKKNK
jgi:hypothetical protein